MGLHKLLIRQMARLAINEQSLPVDLKNWQSLLEFVSNAYTEAEQERYLVDHSIEVASNEFLQLTEKLETAQYIAHLGYWSYEEAEDTLILSNSLYELFGLHSTNHITNKSQFLQLIHEEDRPHFKELVKKVLLEKGRAEHEIRVKNSDGAYGWFNIIGASNNKNNRENAGLSGIAMDINQRKKVEKELETSNQKLMSTARMAGMADVAISVLHNVGNTLNSANVAIGLIQEVISKSHFQKLSTITNMIKENELDIGKFLTQDPKGKLVPEYLIALNETLEKECEIFAQETSNLSRSINHIKQIIDAQQNISKISGSIEHIYLPELIDDALKISGELFSKKDIKINKNYENVGFFKADKTKLIQILVNIFQNAYESISISKNKDHKEMDLIIRKDKQSINIVVEDNGAGISPDNLKNLFTFGFTTKEKGHGFGLHSSILAAQDIGGDLKAESKGEGQGATFTLILPSIPVDIK